MRLRKWQVVIILLISIFLPACKQGRNRPVRGGQVAFYYWKTVYQLGSYEKAFLHSCHTGRIYVRYFDVALNETGKKPVPVAEILFREKPLPGIEYIPVVFITQQTIQQLDSLQIPGMAGNILSLIRQISQSQQILPKEIQIDCDWTPGSREKYFMLLEHIRQDPYIRRQHMTVSCTIRMHQLKYIQHTGIPPVERGMLMCYNMGNLSKAGNHNSILSLKDADNYTRWLSKYPVPLDIALPVFRWGAAFDGNAFKGILYNIEENDLSGNSVAKINPGMYEITADTVIKGYPLKKGLTIRIENPRQSDLVSLTRMLASRVNQPMPVLAFYHLDSTALGPYDAPHILDIINHFQ